MAEPATVQGNRQPVPVQQPQTQNRPVVGGQPVQTQPTVIGSRFQGQGTDGINPPITGQTGIVDPSRPVQGKPVNPELYKDGIISLGTFEGRSTLFVRQDPLDIVKTLVRLDKESPGGAAKAISRIVDTAMQLTEETARNIATISQDGIIAPSGGLTQSGTYSNNDLMALTAFKQGANKSTGEVAFSGVIDAFNLLSLDPSKSEFDSQFEQRGSFLQGDISNDVKNFMKNNPMLVTASTQILERLGTISKSHQKFIQRGERISTNLDTAFQKVIDSEKK